MVGLICFFIVLALVSFEVEGSSPGEIEGTGLGGVHMGRTLFSKKRKSESRHFLQFFQRG